MSFQPYQVTLLKTAVVGNQFHDVDPNETRSDLTS